jgi:hypothetical protein
MARWKLREKHYLNVPGTEWEYKETDRETQRSVRKIYEVPLYLNPDERSDWNYPADEAIIVSNKFDPAHRRDIVFIGSPTPDMEPLDDEAKDISDDFIRRGAWIHPIESLDMNYSQSILSNFERQLAQMVTQAAASHAPNMSLGGVDPKDFAKMQEQVAALMEQNAKLQAEVAERKVVRRV